MNENANKATPAIDQQIPQHLQTATLAMGCFWSPDALFGSMEGVWRTRLGYAGGTTPSPSYRHLNDHIETVQLDFDPVTTPYPQLLEVFFQHHKPIGAPWKRQYMSAIFFHNPEQKKQAEEAVKATSARLGRKIYTAFYPYQAFHPAEDRHQKYKLQRNPILFQEILKKYATFPDLVNGTAAARLNGFLYGYGRKEEAMVMIPDLGLSDRGEKAFLEAVKLLKQEPPER